MTILSNNIKVYPVAKVDSRKKNKEKFKKVKKNNKNNENKHENNFKQILDKMVLQKN